MHIIITCNSISVSIHVIKIICITECQFNIFIYMCALSLATLYIKPTLSHIKKFGPAMDIGLKSVNDTCL